MLIVAEDTLEAKSLWYKYKTSVWREDESPQTIVVHNIMRVLRAIRNQGRLAYATVPITSGRYFYERRLEDPEIPLNHLMSEVIAFNYHNGREFVDDVRRRAQCPVIYPADLTPIHQEWEQRHFQALWLSIIAEKSTEVYLHPGWSFTNGGCEEFTHVMQLKLGLPKHGGLIFYNTKEDEQAERERMRNIVPYSHNGAALDIYEGMHQMEKSLSWIKNHGFEAKRIEDCLEALEWTDIMLQRGFYQ